jgi:signal transduction histidine kinase
MFYGMYFGFFILVVVFQLFFWLTTREQINGWYLPYALFLFLAALMLSGYPANVFDWPDSFATPFLGAVLCLSIAFSSKFTSVLLDLPVVMPRLNRIFLTIFTGLSMATTASVLLGHYAAGVQSAQLTTLILIISSLCLVIYLIRRGHASARFYLLAFGVLDAGVVIRYLRNLGILLPGPLTDYGFYIGSILHLTLISLFIIYRYNAIKRALTIEQTARQEQREFMGMVSHEFRTPLAIISTSVQQLAGNPNAPPEKTLKRYENIKNASRRMSDLMDSYLSADRMDTTEQPLQVQVCDPQRLLGDIIAEWPKDRVRLTTTKLPVEYLCDPELIQVALRNLLANADRHSPKESVIELNATGNENGGMLITVEDHGQGIPDDEISKLFHRYFRGRAARGSPGAGLGLFLVKRIAEAHGGQVTVNSVPGKTSFEMSLPVIKATTKSVRFSR